MVEPPVMSLILYKYIISNITLEICDIYVNAYINNLDTGRPVSRRISIIFPFLLLYGFLLAVQLITGGGKIDASNLYHYIVHNIKEYG